MVECGWKKLALGVEICDQPDQILSMPRHITSQAHFPVRSETVSPKEFQEIATKQRENIRVVRPVLPRLGEGFAKLFVEYRTPVFRLKYGR